jgi:AraC-like DNA-binding protein
MPAGDRSESRTVQQSVQPRCVSGRKPSNLSCSTSGAGAVDYSLGSDELPICAQASGTARRIFLHLHHFGIGRFDRPTRFEPFTKPGAGLFWLESGYGQVQVGRAAMELRPGPWVCLYGTEQARTFIPAEGTIMITRTLWFSGPGLEAWLDELGAKEHYRLRLPSLDRVERAYQSITRLLGDHPVDWEWRIHLVLSCLLKQLLDARTANAGAVRAVGAGIARALDAVDANPCYDWTPRDLATVAGISYSRFRFLFRSEMHQSAQEYLQRSRMEMAKQLLSDPELRISEVASRLKYASSHYFSSAFRTYVGLSPTEYRRLTLSGALSQETLSAGP